MSHKPNDPRWCRHVFTKFLCLLLLSTSKAGLAQDEVPIEVPTAENVDVKADTVKSYFLFSGQSKVIQIDGEDPSSLDEELLTINRVAGTQNQYRITGLRNGTTQIIFFTPDGIMDHIRVSVDVPSVFSTNFLTPRMIGNKPIFSYLFSHTSSFSENDFFLSPSYTHLGTANFPRFLGGNLSAIAQANHEDTLVSAVLNYKKRGFEQTFGNFATSVSGIPTVASSSQLMGSTTEINFGSKTDNRIEAYVGEFKKDDYQQLEQSVDHFGSSYSFSKYKDAAVQPNFLKLSGFGYKADVGEEHQLGAGFDSAYNISRTVSLESNFLKASEGFAGQIGQNLNTEHTTSKLNYSFVKGGLEGFNSTVEEYDKHELDFDLQHLFDDQETFFTFGANFNQSDAAIATLGLDDYMLTGLSSSIAKQYSERHTYSAKYNFSSFTSNSQTALANGLSLNMVHILDLVSYMSHRVSGNYLNSLDTTQKKLQYGSAHLYTMEKEKFLMRSELSWNAYSLDESYQSLYLGQRFAFNLKKMFLLDFNLNYSRPILATNSNSINATQLITASLTHNDFLSTGLGGSYVFGNNSAYSGFMGIQFQKYFGPGIEKDSLLKRVIKGSPKSNIYGKVYLDLNYNSYFDSADQPLANVTVVLDKQTQITTDAQGVFLYPKTKAGQHSLTLNLDAAGPFESEIDAVPSRNLTVESGKDLHLNIPIIFKKAKLQILFAEDSNSDNIYNPLQDKIINIKHAYVTGPDQTTKSHSVTSQGGVTIRGLSAGKYRIAYDPAEIPEELEPASAIELNTTIAENESKTVVFLFRALRVIYGNLLFDVGTEQLSNTLRMQLNGQALPIKNGNFLITNPKSGRYEFSISNLPAGFCVQPPLPYVIIVTEGALERSVEFAIKTQCQD